MHIIMPTTSFFPLTILITRLTSLLPVFVKVVVLIEVVVLIKVFIKDLALVVVFGEVAVIITASAAAAVASSASAFGQLPAFHPLVWTACESVPLAAPVLPYPVRFRYRWHLAVQS